MAQQERATRLVRRIPVTDSRGETRTVTEHGDFMRVRFHDGTWSEWGRSGGRLLMDGKPINPTDVEGVFEVALTREKLTVISPGQ